MTEQITYSTPRELIYSSSKTVLICGICKGKTKNIGFVEEGESNEG